MHAYSSLKCVTNGVILITGAVLREGVETQEGFGAGSALTYTI